MNKNEEQDWLKGYKLPQDVTMLIPQKISKRRQHFIKVPWIWVDRLAGTQSANTYRVALHLLYLHWKEKGAPIKLGNGMLAMDGVTRTTKQRALKRLEQLGLIKVNRRSRNAPIIHVLP
jgi:DNA-binding MarR family transcriptional regulator